MFICFCGKYFQFYTFSRVLQDKKQDEWKQTYWLTENIVEFMVINYRKLNYVFLVKFETKGDGPPTTCGGPVLTQWQETESKFSSCGSEVEGSTLDMPHQCTGDPTSCASSDLSGLGL